MSVNSNTTSMPSDNPQPQAEKTCQFTLTMRESLHRELAVAALASGMTMRGYIMRALRDMGLDITDADLVDRRKRDS
ncbi:MAG: hypothetical protein R3E84_04350 [Pseudomonadales bacterium]